jgi:hypothetical protein
MWQGGEHGAEDGFASRDVMAVARRTDENLGVDSIGVFSQTT